MFTSSSALNHFLFNKNWFSTSILLPLPLNFHRPNNVTERWSEKNNYWENLRRQRLISSEHNKSIMLLPTMEIICWYTDSAQLSIISSTSSADLRTKTLVVDGFQLWWLIPIERFVRKPVLLISRERTLDGDFNLKAALIRCLGKSYRLKACVSSNHIVNPLGRRSLLKPSWFSFFWCHPHHHRFCFSFHWKRWNHFHTLNKLFLQLRRSLISLTRSLSDDLNPSLLTTQESCFNHLYKNIKRIVFRLAESFQEYLITLKQLYHHCIRRRRRI